jgi:hypothetical protein
MSYGGSAGSRRRRTGGSRDTLQTVGYNERGRFKWRSPSPRVTMERNGDRGTLARRGVRREQRFVAARVGDVGCVIVLTHGRSAWHVARSPTPVFFKRDERGGRLDRGSRSDWGRVQAEEREERTHLGGG